MTERKVTINDGSGGNRDLPESEFIREMMKPYVEGGMVRVAYDHESQSVTAKHIPQSEAYR